jgi:hypothetical protein
MYIGIGVTYLVGELVLQQIGGVGSTCLTVKDFQRFLSDFSACSYRDAETSSLGLIYICIYTYVISIYI